MSFQAGHCQIVVQTFVHLSIQLWRRVWHHIHNCSVASGVSTSKQLTDFDPGNGFPFKLFLAMQGPHMDVDAVLAAKKCSHDALANLVLSTFATGYLFIWLFWLLTIGLFLCLLVGWLMYSYVSWENISYVAPAFGTQIFIL